MKHHQSNCSVGAREPDITQEDASSIAGVSSATPSRKRAGLPISSPRVMLFKSQEAHMNR